MRRLIIGCGYLGLPVAKGWVAAGDQVFAMTRRRDRFAEFKSAGIEPLLGDVTQPDSLNSLPAVETVLCAVGMDRSAYSDIRTVYVDGLQNLIDRLPIATGHLIYISSTGVYGNFAGDWVTEDSPTEPTRPGGQASLEAESLIRSSRFFDRATILRFAGIYGPRRVPLQSAVQNQQWDQLPANGHLNLIHVADGAETIKRVAETRIFGETIIVSDGNPVLRKHYYELLAQLLGTAPIQWPESTIESRGIRRGENDKRINNEKLKKLVGSKFLFPDYRAGLHSILRK